MERYLENDARWTCFFMRFQGLYAEKSISGAFPPAYRKHDFEDRLHMRLLRNLLTRYLTVFLFFILFAVSPQEPAEPAARDSFLTNVRTILLLTSYPVADVVTSSFFDAFRRNIRELNLPIDCHVVELNASQKGNEDKVDATFERLSNAINNNMYSVIVAVNHEAADVVMRNYDRIPRSVPVLFAGLGRVPADLKRQYPNSTAIGVAEDTIGTLELGLKLFPEIQNLMLVVDETTISEETRNDILSRCKLHFPQLDYTWINSLNSKRDIQNTLASFPNDSLVLFFPSHDYANGHNETLTAFVRNIGFDGRFPCMALDDTLIGNGVVGGSLIETHRLGTEAARVASQILNAGSAQRIPVKDIAPRKIVDYSKFKSYKEFSGRIPLGTTVVNKPETMWTRHWETFVTIFVVVIIIAVLQVFYFSWMRRRLRTSRNMLYSLPGRVMVLNRAENILFASWLRDSQRERAPKKLDQLVGIDYPKLSQTIHEVFQSGKQITTEYNYEDVHRAISFATLEHDIFGQDAVICFSLDNTELQYARRQAEKYSAQLKKSTRMWDILINFLPIHIFAKDIDDDFRYVFNNRTRCMFYGVGENELNDKTDFDFLPREQAEELRKQDEEFVANPGSGQQERNLDVRNWVGRSRHVRAIQRIFTDEDGTRLLLGTAVDITELEEAHLQMQQLNSKLQELLQQHSILLDNMPSFVMTKDIDDDFRIITCNEACLKFLNKSLESVAGKTDFEILGLREDAEAIHADDLHAVEVLERRPEYHSTGYLHDLNGRVHVGKFYRKLIHASDGRRILFTLFHDVTDMENAKREAEENADRFLLTLRSIGDGIITTDSQGVVTLINPNAEKMLGCKQKDALGRPHTDFFRIVHEQTGRPAPSPLMDALRSGEIAAGEDMTDLISASGRRYHIAANAAPIHTRSGELTGAILVFRDVTDERNKREELHRTMLELEGASEMARLASFRFDFKTNKRIGSTRILRELWPEDENGNALLEEQWVHPEDLPFFKQNMKLLLDGKAPNGTVDFSFRVCASDDIRYYRMQVMIDRSDPSGSSVNGIVQDVTELTLNMLKLKDTQALWNAAINAMPIMFTVKDLDNDCRYLLCNNAFSEIFNCAPDEITGKTDPELFVKDGNLDFSNRLNKLALSLPVNETREFEEELPVVDGRLRSIRTVIRVIRDTSGRRLLLAASSDITDMQRLLTIERINTEMLSRFNREQVFDNLLDSIAGVLRKELGCARIAIAHKEKNVFSVYRQWQYDGLSPVRNAVNVLNRLDWEKRVGRSRPGSIIRIDDLESVADIGELKLDQGADTRESSMVSIPIYENNRLTGGIFLTFLHDRRDFSSLDEAVLTSCGSIVALARQRERSQQAVRRAMLENQLILDNIDVPIWLFNKENALIRTNTAVARVAGRPYAILDQAENDRIFREFSANLKEPDVSIDALVRRTSRLQSTTYLGQDYIVVKDAVRDSNGETLYNMVYAVDVTTMNQLIQNQRFGNELMEEIISEDDSDKSINRTLENVCNLLGASRGCLLEHVEEGAKTHCVAEYVEPTHPHAAFRMLDRTLSRVRGIMENTDDKRTFVCSDTRKIDWSILKEEWHQAALALDLRSIFLSNIVFNGEIWGTVGFNFEGVDHAFAENDVSLLRAAVHMIELILSRKRAKTLIMDALARAQAADKAKSFFIASVSHEIRTPLNSVIGFAELLREGGVSKKQQTEYLDAISSSANALLMLINDVLDLSKLEANQMQIVTAFTDFNALCREVLLIFTFRAQENGNQLVSDVPEDLPELEIDNIRIRQILINLLGNAVKFTKKGTITLRVTFTPDADSADTGTLRCDVSDTGIGISEDDQKKLMEPFVQLSKMRGTNAVNNGTGLGLSISKRLATCMNGTLTCSSSLGEGSTFSVTLNSVHHRRKIAAKKQSAKSAADASIARDVKDIRILVVDDVPMNLRVAKALFNKIGFNNVSTAVSGKDALELLEKQPVDLILSDMWMPEMNGAQLSAAVKGNPKFSHIPIVAQTADVETSGNFDMSNFDAIILKPVTGEKLSNMVKRIIVDGNIRKEDGQDGPFNLG
jgi:PAS domain S-box-containing protein